MKKSARVSEKLVSPGLPGLQVATLVMVDLILIQYWTVKLIVSGEMQDLKTNSNLADLLVLVRDGRSHSIYNTGQLKLIVSHLGGSIIESEVLPRKKREMCLELLRFQSQDICILWKYRI